MVRVGGKRRTDISAALAAWPLAEFDKSMVFFNVHIFKSTPRGSHTNLERQRHGYTSRCKETHKKHTTSGTETQTSKSILNLLRILQFTKFLYTSSHLILKTTLRNKRYIAQEFHSHTQVRTQTDPFRVP